VLSDSKEKLLNSKDLPSLLQQVCFKAYQYEQLASLVDLQAGGMADFVLKEWDSFLGLGKN
jgi:hypothetical protein